MKAMCDVHLVETFRAERTGAGGVRCSYCRAPIDGDFVHVEGHLDDGTPGLYRFTYHPDCAWDVEHDEGEIEAGQGCFNYGEPLDEGAQLR